MNREGAGWERKPSNLILAGFISDVISLAISAKKEFNLFAISLLSDIISSFIVIVSVLSLISEESFIRLFMMDHVLWESFFEFFIKSFVIVYLC